MDRGFADMPLHGGKVPSWLWKRMTALAGPVVESIVLEYGKDAFLRKLSHPGWFQAFGCVLGMDWHSSGITTSVMGALKGALNPRSKELGIYICGGRGRASRNTPNELMQIGNSTGLDSNVLIRSSRLAAKIDNTAIQDGFQIYLHNFIVTDDGNWSIVQQGLNDSNGYARRYHWYSPTLSSWLSNPHASVLGRNQGLILNLVHSDATPTRNGILEVTKEDPTKLILDAQKIRLPAHHDVRNQNVNIKRLGAILASCQEAEVSDFESLLLKEGLGPRTLQSLTLVSEVIHGTPSRFSDPARFSFAHGGKDGHPFPVPLKTYDETIQTLTQSVERAKLGYREKSEAIKSLHKKAVGAEKDFKPTGDLSPLIEHEIQQSPKLGGRRSPG